MKTYSLAKTHRDRTTIWTGTIERLTEAFSYTLLVGNSRNYKINRQPKTLKSLVNNLNASVRESQGCCYNPDYYFIPNENDIESADYHENI